MNDAQFAQLFINTIHSVEQRCMAADGPVTLTCDEITDAELRTLYKAAQAVVSSTDTHGVSASDAQTVSLPIPRDGER